jgi:hypothetical protein
MVSRKKIRINDRPVSLLLEALLIVSLSGVAGAAPTTNIQGSVHQPDGANAIGTITISWPAFTTPSNDQVPAGNLTTTIGADGHVAVDLIPNAGALPTSTLYTAEYHLKDGSSRREQWLVPARPQVTLAEVRGDQAAAVPAQESQQQAPPADDQQRSGTIDRHTEIQKYGFQENRQRSQAPPLSHYTDTSTQHQADFYHDPDRNSFANENDSWLQVCNYTSQQGWTGGSTGWTGNKNNCMSQFNYFAAPGISLGNPRVGPGGWSAHKGISIISTVNSPGISQILGGTQVKAGVGDTMGIYLYNYNYGGSVAASDEGNHLIGAVGGEQSTVYTGKVLRGGAGATSLKVNCTADCEYPGDGRYLIDTQRPVATGFVTAKTSPNGSLTPGTFTVDASVSPSAAWGTLASDVATPVAAEIGTGYTNMTFSINVSHGQFTTGSLVCFGGQFHEQAVVSSVRGANPVSLTVPLRHAHESGSWIMQGGPCGSFIEFTANSVTPGTQTIRYPIDILGATDSHTLVYRYFAGSGGVVGSGYWAGNVTFLRLPAARLSNTDGTVTMTPTAGNQAQHPELYNAASVYISNAANPRFNGICTNTKITPTGQLSCTQSSSNGASSATAEVSYGTSVSGNTAFNLWSGAEVLDVLDHSISPPPVNGTFTLEPNSAPWTVNDTVENVHHYANSTDAERVAVSVHNPMKLTSWGRMLTLLGTGISGGNPAQPTFYAADKISNYESATNYAYHGGTVTPPGGIFLGGNRDAGLFNYGLAMMYAPDPPGSSAFYIGCPASGCGDSGFYYNFFTLLGNGGVSTFTYTPATNILALNGKGLNLKYEPLIAPTMQSETSGGPASLKFSAIDTSGQPHTWILNAPPTGGGFTINLPQSNGTLAMNNAFGASGPTHSAGMVPDPGPNPGATRFLREDGRWVAICRQEDADMAPSFRPAVLRMTSGQDDTPIPVQPKFPAVVAHAARDAQTTASNNIINFVPDRDGTFRLTVSVFIESPCDSGTLSVNAYLSPIAGHNVGQVQNPDCTAPYSNTTSTITAHSAAGLPINAGVGFNGVNAGSLRYMVDAIVEQLQ